MDWKAEVLKVVLPLVIAAIGTAGAWALRQLGVWLQSKGQESKLAAALAPLPLMAEAVLSEVRTGLSDDIERDLADGVITNEELAALRAEAIEELKRALAKRGLPALQAAFGPMLDGVLGHLVDQAQARLSVSSPQ